MPLFLWVLLVCILPLLAERFVASEREASLQQVGDGITPPRLEEVAVCGNAQLKEIAKSLGCGMDGCAWQVALVDGTEGILKVAKDSDAAQNALVKDCRFASALEKAGVEHALKCAGACSSRRSKAAILYPFVKDAKEFGPNQIRLGSNSKHAVLEMLKTAWQMLAGGFVNVDQANNVLYDPVTGDPTFIDFGRAAMVTKAPTGFKAKRLEMQVFRMLYDLIDTVPPGLCRVAKQQVAGLMKTSPPSEVLRPLVEKAITDIEVKKWEHCP
mmetsp:Transcript_70467/g.194813  ORF Transcript_70467/g.194813 Transcript_70467/m.194813 type:complete len:270 (-) Transcript_70467:177-986(-)|eukprot:CAMPEP_0179106456 /NCGR_PEP_ID=MMETSP0796-20121207/49500_1 /TAXON_ID=73915 /ORGANISM="Pyrodinium bahamense, Strain pbaha01" /LENGTH=269 /DNA_ID=CAMNT_0020804489 /DNA_START=45 /DNA_END=854 /DNA_ORIENTATION=+